MTHNTKVGAHTHKHTLYTGNNAVIYSKLGLYLDLITSLYKITAADRDPVVG